MSTLQVWPRQREDVHVVAKLLLDRSWVCDDQLTIRGEGQVKVEVAYAPTGCVEKRGLRQQRSITMRFA